MKTKTVTSRSLAVGFLIFSAALFFSSLLLVRCAGEPRTEVSQIVRLSEEDALLSLKKSLFEYNLAAAPESIPTRGPKWLDVALADMRGAIVGYRYGGVVGAIFVGAVYSLFAALSENVSTQDGYARVDPSDIGLFEDSEAIFIGDMHNRVIKNIFDKYPDIINMTIDQTVKIVQNELSLTSGHDCSDIVSSKEFKREISLIKTIISEGKSLSDEFVMHHPELATEIEIIELYFETVRSQPSQDDVNKYTDGFIKIIDNSPVSSEKKTQLVSGVVTGVNSNNLWDVN